MAKSCREINAAVRLCACARAKGEALHVGGSFFRTPVSALVLGRRCCFLHWADTCTAASGQPVTHPQLLRSARINIMMSGCPVDQNAHKGPGEASVKLKGEKFTILDVRLP